MPRKPDPTGSGLCRDPRIGLGYGPQPICPGRRDPTRPRSKPGLILPVGAILQDMDRATLIEVLRKYEVVLRENGATGLFIFGSRARGADRPDSDLDLFIDYDPVSRVPNMFRLMQIEEQISEALGIPV